MYVTFCWTAIGFAGLITGLATRPPRGRRGVKVDLNQSHPAKKRPRLVRENTHAQPAQIRKHARAWGCGRRRTNRRRALRLLFP